MIILILLISTYKSSNSVEIFYSDSSMNSTNSLMILKSSSGFRKLIAMPLAPALPVLPIL